jgi:hypothetical protein
MGRLVGVEPVSERPPRPVSFHILPFSRPGIKRPTAASSGIPMEQYNRCVVPVPSCVCGFRRRSLSVQAGNDRTWRYVSLSLMNAARILWPN